MTMAVTERQAGGRRTDGASSLSISSSMAADLGIFSRAYRVARGRSAGFVGRSDWCVPPNTFDRRLDADQKVIGECSTGFYTGLCCP